MKGSKWKAISHQESLNKFWKGLGFRSLMQTERTLKVAAFTIKEPLIKKKGKKQGEPRFATAINSGRSIQQIWAFAGLVKGGEGHKCRNYGDFF